MLRRILGVAAGAAVFIAIVAALDGLADVLFPAASSLDPSNPDAVPDNMANIPVGALAIALAGSTLGALAASYITGILVGPGAPYWPFITGAIALAATVANALRVPHPVWFVAAAPVGVIAATVLGWWLSGRGSRPVRKPAPTPPRQPAKR